MAWQIAILNRFVKNYNNSSSNQFASNLQLGNNPNNPETLRSSSRLRLETCSRQGRSVALLLCPFSLKSAVKADFLRSNPGNLTLTLNQQGREGSSDSKATIGLGVITVGGKTMESFLTTSGHEATPNPGNQLSTNSNSYYSAINRDITQTEQNKRDVLTSDFDSKLTLDTRLISAAGNLAVASAKFSAATTASIFGNEQLEAELVASSLDSSRKASANVADYWNQTTEGAKLTSDIVLGTNYSELNPRQSKEGERRTSEDAIPLTLPWFSRMVNENNKVIIKSEIDGKIVLTATDYPAPNLLPGFGKEPIMGIAHESCAGNTCYYLASDQAPLLKVIHQTFPGADSASAFHDAGKYPNDPITTFATIPPYFAVNIIGAIGTFFDVPNWKQNFVDPKTNIFAKPQPITIHQPSNQIPSNQLNATQTNSNKQNGVKNE